MIFELDRILSPALLLVGWYLPQLVLRRSYPTFVNKGECRSSYPVWLQHIAMNLLPPACNREILAPLWQLYPLFYLSVGQVLCWRNSIDFTGVNASREFGPAVMKFVWPGNPALQGLQQPLWEKWKWNWENWKLWDKKSVCRGWLCI